MHILRSLAIISGALVKLTASSPVTEEFDAWSHGRVRTPSGLTIHFRYAGSGPPLLLVHGNPQHSLTWYRTGPLLAQNYTVIAPDNRGAGDSSLAADYNYSSSTTADDLKALLDFLRINETYVFSHDKGAGFASAFAIKYPERTAKIGVSEYILPGGFGYEAQWTPQYTWSLYDNWQLAFFSVPEAAEFFIRGREREMLSWYFFHSSYSGTESIPPEVLTRYADSIAKPGFLRAMFGPFAASTVGADAAFFNNSISTNGKIQVPALVLGSESSLTTPRELWTDVFENLEADIVPKAGHWIADENPVWLANRIGRFMAQGEQIPAVDLSWLEDRATLV